MSVSLEYLDAAEARGSQVRSGLHPRGFTNTTRKQSNGRIAWRPIDWRAAKICWV